MSIGVGTLQPNSRIMRPVWLAGLLAVVVALTVAVIVTNSGNEPVRESGAQTSVSGTAANTPSELRGLETGLDETTVANTPTELRPHVPRRAASPESVSGSFGNTPSELSGGLSAMERYARHQLR